MPIVTDKDIAKVFHLDKYGFIGSTVAKQVMALLKLDQMNELYDRHSHLKSIDFIDAVLKELGVSVYISPSDLKRIPKTVPFICIANHPLGGIDGLVLLKLLLQVNPEAKLMANFLLKNIAPIANHICAVNPFEDRKEAFSSVSGIRSALEQVRLGLPIGIFPAGEVSSRENGFVGKIDDKEWDISAIKFIKKANVPVVPMYFHARNSDLFYLLAGINPQFRTARLPSEMLTKTPKEVILRIGHPIHPCQWSDMNDLPTLTEFLRQKSYILGNVFRKKKIFQFSNWMSQPKQVAVVQNLFSTRIKQEISFLVQKGDLLYETSDYQVYFTDFYKIPAVRLEICRLREITFREIGEGTGRQMDTDEYDDYYKHLILFDHKNEKIVGAYRLGMGEDIMAKFGLEGFYMSELFYMSGPMNKMFAETIEMGRAFIRKEYQQKPFPLFLLWKGIMQVTKMYPQYKYLIGAASISSHYSLFCRSIMVEYLSLHHLDADLSHYIAAKRPFKSALKKSDKQVLQLGAHPSIKHIEKLVEELEPQGLKIPILIKKYLLQNAKLLAFNVDTSFNDAIDALMYIEIDNVKIQGICLI